MVDRIVTIKRGDKKYPPLLAQIPGSPKVIYCRGNLDLLATPCIAIVGTRKITPYGKEATQYMSSALVNAGFTIVSGLAFGIDAVAHQAALDAGGKTIAVLGTGIEHLYPKENEQLGKEIIASGSLVISEYPETVPGQKFTFPLRNRIISGLSVGTVVIEADKQSGALITATAALEQNRDVFAVPGNIFSPRSVGPNLLIQKGAKLVLSPQDIVEEYTGQKNLFAGENRPLSTGQNPVEEKILAILNQNGPTHIDTIITQSELESSKIMATVSLLEIKSQIKHLGNGIYKI